MKLFAIVLAGVGKGMREQDGGRVNLTNMQCKAIQKCHNESLYNLCMLKTEGEKKKKIGSFKKLLIDGRYN
jgi:hypothetical protein